MHARTTSIHADPRRVDDGVRHVRDEVLPAVTDMPGCIGLSMLCDRGSGRSIVTTSWDSAESLNASRDAGRGMRDRAAALLGGHFDVQEWEIGVLHRAQSVPEGACCRVTWTRGHPARTDEMLSAFRTAVMPRLDDLPGFCSVSVVVDRRSGLSAVTAVYDGRESLSRSSGNVTPMRDRFAQELGLAVVDVVEMEVALHHLRVPEMV